MNSKLKRSQRNRNSFEARGQFEECQPQNVARTHCSRYTLGVMTDDMCSDKKRGQSGWIVYSSAVESWGECEWMGPGWGLPGGRGQTAAAGVDRIGWGRRSGVATMLHGSVLNILELS